MKQMPARSAFPGRNPANPTRGGFAAIPHPLLGKVSPSEPRRPKSAILQEAFERAGSTHTSVARSEAVQLGPSLLQKIGTLGDKLVGRLG